jgi:hypothetical protein
MGANLYALTWYDITNYVGLDITAKSYSRGAYSLCKLSPTKRRKPPAKKQNEPLDNRASASSTTEPVKQTTGTTTELVKPVFDTFTVTTIENNVVLPLHVIKSVKPVKRIVGVKGKSGIAKPAPPHSAYALAETGLIH